MIQKNKSKLGVLIPGMGAVASTFICGVIACNKGLSKPIGSMTQMGSIRLGKRTENRTPLVKDFVPTVDMQNLIFTGWDINDENVYVILELNENAMGYTESLNTMNSYYSSDGSTFNRLENVQSINLHGNWVVELSYIDTNYNNDLQYF